MRDERVVLPMWARLEIFLHRLRLALPVGTHDEAMELIANTLFGVEEEFCSVPYDPEEKGNDGRMYPPKSMYRNVKRERPGVICYRQFGHITFVADNGAFEIRVIERRGDEPLEYTIIDKPGRDGRKVASYGDF